LIAIDHRSEFLRAPRLHQQAILGVGLALLCSCAHPSSSAPVAAPLTPAGALLKTARQIELNGTRLRWLDASNADSEKTPWLFVHGIGGRMEDFGPLLPSAARSARVLALDLPGFGESTNPEKDFRLVFFTQTIRALLDRLEVNRIRLVCHSMGGQICIALTLEDAARVESLTLIDAAGTYDPRTYAQGTLKRRVGLNLGVSEGARNPMIEMLTGDQTLIKRMLSSRTTPLAALWSFKTNLRRRVAELRVPTLIIWGTDDQVFPVEEGLWLKENVRGSELHLIEGGTHTPFEDHHAAILEWMQAFATRPRS
jgi:pimeloyl-ACP methyl ester carboxylesterase